MGMEMITDSKKSPYGPSIHLQHNLDNNWQWLHKGFYIDIKDRLWYYKGILSTIKNQACDIIRELGMICVNIVILIVQMILIPLPVSLTPIICKDWHGQSGWQIIEHWNIDMNSQFWPSWRLWTTSKIPTNILFYQADIPK